MPQCHLLFSPSFYHLAVSSVPILCFEAGIDLLIFRVHLYGYNRLVTWLLFETGECVLLSLSGGYEGKEAEGEVVHLHGDVSIGTHCRYMLSLAGFW